MSKHGRLIDADALGNRMYHEAFEKDSEDQKWDSGCWIRYKLFERVLREQPTIELEREKGEWIPVTNGRGGHECNKCHNYAPAWQTGEERLTDFCPCCGADLRGEPDD